MSARRSALIVAAALAFAPVVARAHLKVVYATAGDTLAEAATLALVELEGKPQRTPEGQRVTVRRVSALAGDVPERFEMVQEGHHLHALRRGDRVLAPLSRTPAGRWAYTGETRAALRVDPRTERAALRFVRTWRAARDVPLVERVDVLIGATRHPARLVRGLALEMLALNAQALRPTIDARRLDALAAPLLEPGGDVADREALLRLLGVLAEARGAAWLAAHLDGLSPRGLRHSAATLIGRFDPPGARDTLQRCVRTGGGTLATHCARVLARLGPADTP